MTTQGQHVAEAIDRAGDKIAVAITALGIAITHLAVARSGYRPEPAHTHPDWPKAGQR